MNSKIDEYEKIKQEIFQFRKLLPLGFVALDCSSFNNHLINKLDSLINVIVLGEAEKNRNLLNLVLDTFEEMASKTSEKVETTTDLVNLTNYLNQCMSDTFFKMKVNINEAMQRLLFLLDHYIFEGKAPNKFLSATIFVYNGHM